MDKLSAEKQWWFWLSKCYNSLQKQILREYEKMPRIIVRKN
jgi:hypothetical protein